MSEGDPITVVTGATAKHATYVGRYALMEEETPTFEEETPTFYVNDGTESHGPYWPDEEGIAWLPGHLSDDGLKALEVAWALAKHIPI